MRGLLFAVVFCAVSLLFAETLTSLLVNFSVIEPHEFEEVHGLIMFFLLAVYMGYAPTFPQDHQRKDDGDKNSKDDS